MGVTTIVFDMGDVLWNCDIMQFVRMRIANAADQTLLYRELFRSVEWAQLDLGSIPMEDALDGVQARLPERLHEPARSLLYGWYDDARPFPGMEPLIRRLKANGYRLYVLSNIHKRLRQKTELLPASDCFSGFFLSGEHGVLKPDPRIYALFCKTYGLTPSECLFVDDSPHNVEGAQRFGMQGLVFHMDADELARKLLAMGIRV